MKLLVSCLTLLSFILAEPVQADELELKVSRISPDVIAYQVEGDSQRTNVYAIDSDAGIVIIDTHCSQASARLIKQAVAVTFGCDKFVYVINTHGHGDHWWGNCEFPDAEIIAHADAVKTMQGSLAQQEQLNKRYPLIISALTRKLDKIPDEKIKAQVESQIRFYKLVSEPMKNIHSPKFPATTFSESYQLDLGNKTLHLLWFGYSHSEGDILVYCPEEKVLFSGDLFFEDNPLYVDSQRIKTAKQWKNAFQQINEYEIDLVLPGHGQGFKMETVNELEKDLVAQLQPLEGKESAFLLFAKVFEEKGQQAALDTLDSINAKRDDYFFLAPEFDSFAFKFILSEEFETAKTLAEAFLKAFPNSSLLYDTLGEIHLNLDQKEQARQCYEKSIELDPDNRNAQSRLDQLKSEIE